MGGQRRGLHLGGHSGWGAATAFAALFSLLATMLRVGSGHHGFRLGRLWVDRVVVTVALAAATAGVAVSEPGGPGVVGGFTFSRTYASKHSTTFGMNRSSVG